MALTRKSLAALGIEDDKIDSIIAGHTETVSGLKDKIDELDAKAKKYDDLSKEKDELSAKIKELESQVEKLSDNEDLSEKYSALEKEYNDYKKSISDKEALEQKKTAYKALLSELKISEKRHEGIIKLSNIDDLKLDKDGKIKDVDDLKKSLTEEWSEFIETDGKHGTTTPNPPDNKGGGEVKQPSRAAMLQAKYQSELYGNKSDVGAEGNNNQ